MIRTDRLLLIPATVELLEAELEGRAALARATGYDVTGEWPPELYDEEPLRWTLGRLREHPEESGWWLHYIVEQAADGSGTLIGCAGYKGPPAGGVVEIGYSVIPSARRRGFASEAVRALLQHAFARDDVHTVIAETLPHLHPSIGVMESCGLRYVGEGSEEGVIRYSLSRTANG